MPADSETYTFGKDVEPGVSMTNFSPPEDGFIWSTGPWCQVGFGYAPSGPARPRPGGGGVDIALDLDVYKFTPDLDGQNVFFYVNGLRLASRFVTKRVTILLEVQASILRLSDNIITIDTPEAARPLDHGGEDTRRLGIQLFTLRVAGS